MAAERVILITGANGAIGRILRQSLKPYCLWGNNRSAMRWGCRKVTGYWPIRPRERQSACRGSQARSEQARSCLLG